MRQIKMYCVFIVDVMKQRHIWFERERECVREREKWRELIHLHVFHCRCALLAPNFKRQLKRRKNRSKKPFLYIRHNSLNFLDF
jgi:hypothetical protein